MDSSISIVREAVSVLILESLSWKILCAVVCFKVTHSGTRILTALKSAKTKQMLIAVRVQPCNHSHVKLLTVNEIHISQVFSHYNIK